MKWMIHNKASKSVSGLGIVMQTDANIEKFFGHIVELFDAKDTDEAIEHLNRYEKENGYLTV